MIKKLKLPHTLKAQMLYVSIIGLVLGMFVYLAVQSIGTLLVDDIYMSSSSVGKRKAEIYAAFSNFVNAEGISGKDSAAVARWTEKHEYVTIYLFGSNREQQSYSGGRLDTAGSPKGYDRGQYGKLYPIHFVDGLYQIAIDDNSQVLQRQLVKIIAFVCASLSFLCVSMLYTGRLTRRIISLSKEAAEVSAGDIERSIPYTGDDELSVLGQSMDEMRRSVIERLGSETRAWQANSELITAISHDIRTPMTSLIGYLGILNDNGLEDRENSEQFISTAYAKAMELKDLTDQLFRYFLVYGKAELELNTDIYDARLLLEQLLGEAEFDLSDSGFTVHREDFKGECSVSADPLYLKRVFDNMVSNVKKYADRERPVLFTSRLEDGRLYLRAANYISRSMDRVESTKIGLRTCEKIMSAMNGGFGTESESDRFSAELMIPVIIN